MMTVWVWVMKPEAAAWVRQILAEIGGGGYVRPSEGRKRLLSDGRRCRLTKVYFCAFEKNYQRGSRGCRGWPRYHRAHGRPHHQNAGLRRRRLGDAPP